jgi:hypothetical protein
MKRFTSSITYANVVSTLCLVLVVGGGTAFAATELQSNSVGADQIKRNAITTAKIRNGAVTGVKINEATLGTVPMASRASSAGSAETAGRASSADFAARASAADSANRAVSAGNADTLGGLAAGAFVQGPGVVKGARKAMTKGDPDATLFNVPGFGQVGMRCNFGEPEPGFDVTFYNDQITSGFIASYLPGEPFFEAPLEPELGYSFALNDASLGQIHVSSGDQLMTLFVGAHLDGNECILAVQAVAAGA